MCLPVVTQIFSLQLFGFSAKPYSTYFLCILRSKDICKELMIYQEITTVYLTVTTKSISIEVLVHFILLTTWRPGGRIDLSKLIIIDDIRISRKLAAPWLNPFFSCITN